MWNIKTQKKNLINGNKKLISLMQFYFAVQALREIAAQVGKKDWNFGVDPFSNDSIWATLRSSLRPLYNNSLICNCSYPSGVCHVIKLYAHLPF